ncbi:MAG: hypothetical protein ACXQTP_05695 [Candidatus Methanofastidiosia archaeon]
MKNKGLILSLIGILILFTITPIRTESPTIVLTETTPEKCDPLQEITLNIMIVNTTGEQMWSPEIRIDLSDDTNNYFTLVDESVIVDLEERQFLAPDDSVNTSVRIMANANCPAEKHTLLVILNYRKGSCAGGCEPATYKTNISVQIYRKDPKIALFLDAPTEAFPGDPFMINITLRNFGTGPALNMALSATSEPEIQDITTYFYSQFDPPELCIACSIAAVTEIDTAHLAPGFYNIFIEVTYEDKYGEKSSKKGDIEIKIKGTARQEALLQAQQLKELGQNAFQLKEYATAISYLERAIEIFERLDMSEDISRCDEIIQLSTTYIQANNYYLKGDRFFEQKNYQEAKRFYTLALDIYNKLENEKKKMEVERKIDTCNDELYRYKIMRWAIYCSAIFCIAFAVVTRKEYIMTKLKR